MFTTGKTWLACTSGIALAFSATPAFALAGQTSQDAPETTADNTDMRSADIVVTARRRAENLQDVPLTVAALSPEQLETQNVRDTFDLSKTAPSVLVTKGGGGGNQVYASLRGVGGQEVLFGQDQTVGFYFDEVPVARQEGGAAGSFDLEGVQILYGPQGTLFGRNTTSGAILYSTRRASFDTEGFISAEYGNYNQFFLTGAVNLPFSETLAVRFAGQVQRRKGYITEVNSGLDLNNISTESARMSLRWEPSAAIRSDLIVSYSQSDERTAGGLIFGQRVIGITPCTATSAATAAANRNCTYGPTAPFRSAASATQPSFAEALALNLSLGKERIALKLVPRNVTSVFGVTNITTFDLSSEIQLKNVISYRNTDYASESQGTPFNILIDLNRQALKAKQYSEELQLQGTVLDGQLDFTLGGFYFKETGRQVGGSLGDTFNGSEPYLIPFSFAEADNVSKSLFGQVVLKPSFLPGLGLTAGIRNTWDDRSITLRSGIYPVGPLARILGAQTQCNLFTSAGVRLPTSACALSGDADFTQTTWLLSADYEFVDGVRIYGSHSKGYRSGGFNARSLSNIEPFQPESVLATEVGLKTSFDLGSVRFRFNADYWWFDYSDIQTVQVITVPGTTQRTTSIANSNSLKLHGGEVELFIEPVRGVTLQAFYGNVEGTYDKFNAGTVILSGLEYTAPKHSWGGNLFINQEIGDAGALQFSASYFKRTGGLVAAIITTTQQRGPATDTADARITWERVMGSNFDVSLYAENILGGLREVRQGGTNGASATIQSYVNEPTLFGAAVKMKF